MRIGGIRQIPLAPTLLRGLEQIAGPRWRKHLPERTIKIILLLCSSISIFTTIGIVSVLIFEAVLFFQEVTIVEFLTSTEWTPLFASQNFGIWPLVTGTMLTSIGAMLVALPLGLLSAVYLSEYAPGWARRILKPVLEILAGVPTVVYGFFALLFVTPILRQVSEDIAVFNATSAAIVMGIMILPIETMTAYIVQVSMGDAPTGTLEFRTIFAVGLSLFVITLGMNLLSQIVVRKFREVYE